MQYADSFALVMVVVSALSIYLMLFSPMPSKASLLTCTTIWTVISISFYFYNRMLNVVDGLYENCVYGFGVFSFVYTSISLWNIYKSIKLKSISDNKLIN